MTEGVKEGRRGHEDGYASSSSEEDDSEEAYVRMHALKEMEERGLTGNFVTWVQYAANHVTRKCYTNVKNAGGFLSVGDTRSGARYV